MKLAFIVPSSYIKEVDKYCDLHLFLSHLLYNNSYAAAVLSINKYKILDNGAFETGIPEEGNTLLSKMDFVKANEVICPDIFYNTKETLKKVKTFISFLKKKKELRNYKLQASIHGRTLNELLYCYAEYLDIKEIDVIGIGYTAIKYSGFSRIEFIRGLQGEGLLQKSIHLLGLGNNGGEELKELGKCKFIRSNDSSAAYVLARDNKLISPIGKFERNKKPIDFNDEYKLETYLTLKRNMQTLRRLG